MTVEQQSGWAILIVSLVVVLIASLALVASDLTIVGVRAIVFHIPRFYVWLLRGSAVARWLLVVLLACASTAVVYGAVAGAGVRGPILASTLGLLYLAPAALIATSSSVSAYLTHRRKQKTER